MTSPKFVNEGNSTTLYMTKENFSSIRPIHRVKTPAELGKKLSKEGNKKVKVKLVGHRDLKEMHEHYY